MLFLVFPGTRDAQSAMAGVGVGLWKRGDEQADGSTGATTRGLTTHRSLKGVCLSPWINFSERGFRSCSRLGQHSISKVS